MNTYRKTICVSIPRSGHHMLVNLIGRYLKGFTYCEYYRPEDCCKQVPCIRPHVFLQKNHDFDLKTPASHDLSYIVQYRNPMASAVSDFEFMRMTHEITHPKQYWYMYAVQRRNFWLSFIRKWFLATDISNIIYVPYEEFVGNPLLTFTRLARFLDPGKPIDIEKLYRAIEDMPIGAKRNVTDFDYFDPLFFYLMEESISEYMKLVGTPSCLGSVSDQLSEILTSPPDERSLNLAFFVLLERFPKESNVSSGTERHETVAQMVRAIKASEEFRNNIAKTRTYNAKTAQLTPQKTELLFGDSAN